MSGKTILDLETLKEAVENAAAIRLRVPLEPVGGKGDKVFPPTYLGAKEGTKPIPTYPIEKRVYSDGKEKCAVLDSVQSQANRLEQELQDAVDSGDISLPVMKVEFSTVKTKEGENRLTTLTAPHRWADSYFYMSKKDETNFADTEIGKSLKEANPKNATGLFQYCPTSLLFGIWDSHGEKGGMGVKFQRCLVSEIVAYGIETGRHFAGKGDPMVNSSPKFDPKIAGKYGLHIPKQDKASAYGLGMIAPNEIRGKDQSGKVHPLGGITAKRIEQVSLISLTSLRKLHFPLPGKDANASAAARTVIAAIGLYCLIRQFESGYSLRSRCDLRALDSKLTFEVVRNGKEQSFSLGIESAEKLLKKTITEAENKELQWKEKQVFQATEELEKWIKDADA